MCILSERRLQNPELIDMEGPVASIKSDASLKTISTSVKECGTGFFETDIYEEDLVNNIAESAHRILLIGGHQLQYSVKKMLEKSQNHQTQNSSF